jgi:radical SAM protein with 4Fe4S-binding SPASM domain
MEFSPKIIQAQKSTQDFFEEYYEGRPYLTNMHIEITSMCNERCLHCYIPHESKVNQMSPELFHDILMQCIDLKLLNITISGGEPMLHKNFCEFLKMCREHDFSVNVLSNLTLLNDDVIQEMRMNPLLSIQVSLYSMDSDVHDEITQLRGSFEKTKNAILELVANDIPMQISCPIMKQNKNTYKDVIRWAQKQKIHVGDDFSIIADYNHSKQNLSCRLSISEIKEVIIDKAANDIKYLEQIYSTAQSKNNMNPDDFVCTVCRSTICIAENGNVYPCEGWQDYVVGNIKDTPLNDIWDNSEKVRYLRSIRNKDFSQCTQCDSKEFCTICMVRNANENPMGNPLAVNEFFCNIAKLNKEIVHEWKTNNRTE